MKSYAWYPGARLHPFAASLPTAFPRTYTREYRRPTASHPAANIIRQENGFVIEMAIPGLTKEQLTIQMDQDQLIIAATAPSDAPQMNFVRSEFDYTTFKRAFRLHKNANVEAMTATVNQGVLVITIPDREPVTRKIEIQ